ncbi:MAG TPA: hypothetical protein VN517_07450, partial [Terriglobales bacterium]|nr:hypothetical protein [Terriglobales bacterium]
SNIGSLRKALSCARVRGRIGASTVAMDSTSERILRQRLFYTVARDIFGWAASLQVELYSSWLTYASDDFRGDGDVGQGVDASVDQ